MSLFISFKKCVTEIFECLKLDINAVDITWGHVILFYAKCGIILSENDFLGREPSEYLQEILTEIAKPKQIIDYVSEILYGIFWPWFTKIIGHMAVILKM